MKAALVLAVLAMAALPSTEATEAGTNPLSKTIELLESLKAKVLAEGEAEAKAFKDYMEWCDDTTKNGAFLIKSLLAKKEKAESCIDKSKACLETCSTSAEELAAAIATAEAELKNATLIRDKEKDDFLAAEAELADAIDTLERAINIISREMAKNPALLQKVDTSSVERLTKSLGVVIAAAALSVPDQKKLVALVQDRAKSLQSEDDRAEADEAVLGAPDPAVYKTHSTSIVEVLEDMLEKAEAELKDLRKAETNAQHNYDLLKQSLTDEIAANEKAMADNKATKEGCESELATCTADLTQLEKDIAAAEEDLKTAQNTCMQVAADHEVSLAGRAEEIKGLTAAIKILKSTTPDAEAQTYSLLQVLGGSALKTRADLANAEIVSLIKRLAQKEHSAALAQLASKITAVMRYGSTTGDDVFAKIKGLIKDLIDRLMKEAAAEATEKAYCDSEMAKTEAKKSELEDDVAKLSAKIDKAAATSASLKEDVKELQAALAALAKTQAEMDKMRKEESAQFLAAKSELEMGITGVNKALEVLRAYYGGAFLQGGASSVALAQQPPLPEFHEKASGAGGSIIDILEVVLSDFSSELAKRTTEESDAQSAYEKMTQENKVEKTMKEQDVKYKTQEFKSLDKAVAEMTSDRETEQAELDAVLEYFSKLKDRCIAKPETYAERKRRREAEIAGLKEALTILESETAFVQRGLRATLRR